MRGRCAGLRTVKLACQPEGASIQLNCRMTKGRESDNKSHFTLAWLPWILGLAALVGYSLTLNRSLSFLPDWLGLMGSAPAGARTAGWFWQPELMAPAYYAGHLAFALAAGATDPAGDEFFLGAVRRTDPCAVGALRGPAAARSHPRPARTRQCQTVPPDPSAGVVAADLRRAGVRTAAELLGTRHERYGRDVRFAPVLLRRPQPAGISN